MQNKFVTYSISSAMFDIGNNLMRVFGIVFFYVISGNNIYIALGAYLLSTIINLILLIFIPKYIGLLGTKNSLIISRIFYLSTAVPIYFLDNNNYIQVLIIWSILYGIGKTFLFIPYHYIVGNLTSNNNRGKLIGLLYAISSILGIIAPFFAGIVSSTFGSIGYSITIALTFFISISFLIDIPNLKYKYTGNVLKCLNLKNVKYELKYTSLANFQNQTGFWQVYIYQILNSSFLNLGFITTGVNIVGVLLNIILGKWLDNHSKDKAVRFSGFLQSSGWLMRLISNTPLGIFISDSYMHLTGQALGQSLSTFTYDKLSINKEKFLFDEKIIAREIFLTFLGIITFIVAFLIFSQFGFTGIFLFAFLASLLIAVV